MVEAKPTYKKRRFVTVGRIFGIILLLYIANKIYRESENDADRNENMEFVVIGLIIGWLMKAES